MNATFASTTSLTASPAAPPATNAAVAPAPASHAALAHLFRASLRQGRLHPLYVPMQQYRGGQGAAPA